MQNENSGSETAPKNQTTIERASDRELVITRTFNAPAALVFDAWTKPELVKRWWAPKSTGMQLVTCEIDLRAGGKYRYVFHRNGEKMFEAFGKYTLVQRPTRLEWTDDEVPAGATEEARSFAIFEEHNGKTTVRFHSIFPSKEVLEEVESGMGAGTLETFEQLAELVAASNAG